MDFFLKTELLSFTLSNLNSDSSTNFQLQMLF